MGEVEQRQLLEDVHHRMREHAAHVVPPELQRYNLSMRAQRAIERGVAGVLAADPIPRLAKY
eukprot:scaffold55790_cov69-Phaeocystis_antarctica.AAC.3